jgi:hypothetical protein
MLLLAAEPQLTITFTTCWVCFSLDVFSDDVTPPWWTLNNFPGNRCYGWLYANSAGVLSKRNTLFISFINTLVSLAIPSLQLRPTTSLFSNLDSTLKTNSQYLSIDECRVLVLICSHILLRSCLAQIPLALCSAFSSDHYAHQHSSSGLVLLRRRVASL